MPSHGVSISNFQAPQRGPGHPGLAGLGLVWALRESPSQRRSGAVHHPGAPICGV